MSAEQQDNFSFTSKTKQAITDYLKELVEGNNYIITLDNGDIVEITINRSLIDKIAIKIVDQSIKFPNNKSFAIINYATQIKDGSIEIDNYKILSIKEKEIELQASVQGTPVEAVLIDESDVTARSEEVDIETMSVQDDMSVSSESSTGDDSLVTPDEEITGEFEFDIDDVVVEEDVELREQIVTKALSLWDREITVEKRKALISELLIEYHKDKKHFDTINRDVNIFNELNTNEIFVDSNDTTLDQKPFQKKMNKNRFNETNIYPIVQDNKIFYNNKSLPEPIDGVTILPKPVLTVKEQEDDEVEIGEITLRIQLLKNYHHQQAGILGYKDYIRKLYEGGSIKVEISDDDSGNEMYDTTFNNLNLTHSAPKDQDINHEYYTIQAQSEQTKVYRNCTNEDPCAIDPFKEVTNPANQIKLATRMTIPMEYCLKDVYDDKYIVDSKGNKKKDVRSCNGTNKTGDSFYIGDVDELKKSISKPPKKEVLYPGETLKIIGFFIESPYNKKKNIIATGEHTLPDNTKVYPKLHNDTLNLGDLGKKIDNSYDIEIIDNIENFQYNKDYDPSKNYFVYFNKNTTNEVKKLDEDQYKQFIERIIPSKSEILDIESENLKKAISIDGINRILSDYGLQFDNLDKASVNRLKKNILRNLDEAREVRVTDGTKKYDTIKLNHLFNKIYKAINNLKLSIENQVIGTEDNIEEVNRQLKSQIKIYFNTVKSVKIIKLFLTRFLNYDGSLEEKSMDDLVEISISLLNQREGNITNKSIINSLINSDPNIHPDIQELITKYLQINDLSFDNTDQPMNKKFSNSDLYTFAVINNLKNSLFNGDEFKDIINLINLQAIKFIIDNKYSDEDITSQAIAALNTKKQRLIGNFVEEKKIHTKFLTLCNGVKIKKMYTSLNEVNEDNNKTIYADKSFSKINSVYNTIIEYLLSNDLDDIAGNESEIIDLLMKSYMFITSDEIDRYMLMFKKDIIDNLDLDIRSAKEKLGSYNEKVLDSDYALLNTDKKYLFFRKGDNWISIDKDSYDQIQKCFMYKQDVFNMSLDEIADICKISSAEEDIADIDCIKIGDNYIPKPIYQRYLEIENLKNKINLVGTLLTYKNSIEDRILSTRKSITNKIRITYSKKLQKNSVFNYKKDVEKLKQVYPSKKLRAELSSIYKISDFDMRIQQLMQFIDRNGIMYNRKESVTASDENYEYTAKWVYYDSNVIDVPICCKHYLDYKEMLFRDNATREVVLEKIKNKWSKGSILGNTYVCSNCGEALDTLNYSEFEGFGKDNKVINFREKVVEIIDEDNEDLEINMDQKLNTVNNILGLISNKIGIILKDIDIEFIEDFVSKKYLLNSSEFFREIYNSRSIFDVDFNSSDTLFGRGKRDAVIKKLPKLGTTQEKFKIQLHSLLTNLFEDGRLEVKNIYNLTRNASVIQTEIRELIIEKRELLESIIERPNDAKVKALSDVYNIALKNLINAILTKHYKAYVVGELVSYTIASVSDILVYAKPSYKLISLGAERKEKKSGFFIKKLTKELAIDFIYSKIQQEESASRNEPLLKSTFRFLKDYLTIINPTYKFTSNLSSDYRKYLEEILEEVESIEYMEDLIVSNQLDNLDEDHIEKEYKWSTFLPPLDVNMELSVRNLDLPSLGDRDSISGLISEYNTNLLSKIAIEAAILTEDTDLDKKSSLLSEREAMLVRNNTIVNNLHGYYTKLGFFYMSIINRKIFEIDNQPYMLSSYISSLGYDKLNKNYIDYFVEKFSDISSTLTNIQLKMDEINIFLSNIKDNVAMFRVNNVNNVARNLQGYMKFNPKLYTDRSGVVDQVKIKKYLIKQLVLINTLTILDDEAIKYQKRNYITLSDDDYNAYIQFKLRNASIVPKDEMDDKFIEFLKETKGIDIGEDEVKKGLIFRFNGTALYDIVSNRFKKDIEKSVIDKYSSYENTLLENELRSLNVEFSKASLIKKTVTFPMINNLIPFKYKTDKDSLSKMLSVLSSELKDNLTRVAVSDNLRGYIDNVMQSKSEIDGGLITETTSSIKEKIRSNKLLLDDKYLQKIFIDFISMEDIYSNLNSNYYLELINHSENFIEMSASTPLDATNGKEFKTKLMEVFQQNSNLNIYLNILSIIISYLNRIKNLHISPQNTDGSKLKYLFDDSETNLILISGDYMRKLDNLSEYSQQLISDLRSDESAKEFLEDIPQTNETVQFLNNLLTINKKITQDNRFEGINLLMPLIIKVFVKDIIANYTNILISKISEYKGLFSIVDDMLNEIVFYLQTYNKTDLEIQDTIKRKRKKENTQRKNNFDRMTSDMQNIQKLMRRFNLGDQFAARNNDIEINDEQIYQGDTADHTGLNMDEQGDIIEDQIANFNGNQAEQDALVMGGADFYAVEEMGNVFEEEF